MNRNYYAIIFAAMLICANSPAQIIIDPGVTTDGDTKQKPPPGEARVRTRDAFDMSIVDLEMKTGEPVFMLKVSEKETLGPFEYKDGTKIGKKDDYYTIVEASGTSFRLKTAKTPDVFGPFTFADGKQITIGPNSFEIVIDSSLLWGVLEHPGILSKNNIVYLLQMNDGVYKGLAELRYKFITLHDKHEYYKAPRQLAVPEIRSITGHKHSNIINRSQADIAKDSQSTDSQARLDFQNFCKKNSYKTSKPNYNGMYSFGTIKPGRYMVCCETMKKNDDGNELIRNRPAFWWTGVTLEAGDSVRLDLTDKNDLDWRDLFVKEHKKDEL